MSTLILYESKHGATKTCATYLKEHLVDATLQRLSEFDGDLSEYHHVVVGSSVYMGQFNKHVRRFLTERKQELLTHNLSILFCAMNETEIDAMLSQNLDDEIRTHATIVHGGGAYDFSDLNFLERFAVKKIAKVSESIDAIQYDNLNQLIKKVNA